MRRAGRLLLVFILAWPAIAQSGGVKRLPKLGQAKTAVLRRGGRAPSPAKALRPLLPLAPRAANPAKPLPTAFSRLEAGASSGLPANAGGEQQKFNSDQAFEDPGAKKSGNGGAGPVDGSGGNGGSGGPGGSADDGGGPDYSRRKITRYGKRYDEVAIRPNVPVEDQIVQALDTSKESFHVALYEFKSTKILNAIRRALLRGIQVHVVLDYSVVFPTPQPGDNRPAKCSEQISSLLAEIDMPDVEGRLHVKVLRGLGRYGINHNKFAVSDYFPKAEKGRHPDLEILGEYGSFNWNITAEKDHYENAIFTKNRKLVDFLMAYWNYLDSIAKPLTAKSVPSDYAWPVQISELPPMPEALSNPPLNVEYNGIRLPSFVATPSVAPGRTLEDREVAAMEATKKGQSIDVNVFALESVKIVAALARAHARGVAVRVVMDEGQAYSSIFGPYAQWLAYQGIPVRTRAGPDPNSKYPRTQKNHHKFMIFDDRVLENGSANPTKQSSIANFENAHFIDDAKIIAPFRFVFDHLWSGKISKPFPPPQTEPALPTDEELTAATYRDPDPAPAPKAPFEGPRKGTPAAAQVSYHGLLIDDLIIRPDKPIAPSIIAAIDKVPAGEFFDAALYEFDNPDILDALRRAKKRGVAVRIVIDHNHVYTTGLDRRGRPSKPSAEIVALINEKFDILVHKPRYGGIQHNKYAIFGGKLVKSGGKSVKVGAGLEEDGTYNWTKSSENNHFEIAQFSADAQDIGDLQDNFDYIRERAEPVDREKLDAILSRGSQELGALHAESDSKPFFSPEAAPEPAGPSEAGDKHAAAAKPEPPPPSQADPVRALGTEFRRRYFSPGEALPAELQIKEAWLKAIQAAKESFYVIAFAFSDPDIAYALRDASKKGLDVRVIQEDSQAHAVFAKVDGIPIYQWFVENGVPYKFIRGPNQLGDPNYDPQLEKQHIKGAVADGKLLEIGSYNPTKQANLYNQENATFSANRTKVLRVLDLFRRLWDYGWEPGPPPKAPQPDVKPLGPRPLVGA